MIHMHILGYTWPHDNNIIINFLGLYYSANLLHLFLIYLDRAVQMSKSGLSTQDYTQLSQLHSYL